ncbi:unnamed protein product [Discosporangium mesarthrocarpum]
MRVAWGALQASLEALVLLWMLVPGAGGGFAAWEAGLALSMSAMVMAVIHLTTRQRVLRVVNRSPVTVLRVATAVQVRYPWMCIIYRSF